MPIVVPLILAFLLLALVVELRRGISTGPWMDETRARWHLLFQIRAVVFPSNVLLGQLFAAIAHPRLAAWPALAGVALALLVSEVASRWWARRLLLRPKVRTAQGLQVVESDLYRSEQIRYWASVPPMGWLPALTMLLVCGIAGFAAGRLLP